MKNKRKITAFSLIITMFIIIFFLYRAESIKYNSILLFEDYILSPEHIYTEYNTLYGEYPLSNKEVCDSFKTELVPPFDSIAILDDIKNLSEQYLMEIDWRWNYYYNNSIDPLSKNKKIFVYYPIYNRLTKKRDNYLILSTGLDGILNNNISKTDTLYSDDWIIKLKLYNKNDALWRINEKYNYLNREEVIKYNPFQKKFGKKDYAIIIGNISN